MTQITPRLDVDADAIRSMAERQKKAVQEQTEWAEDITYRTEVGLLFKEKLAISPDGVEWQGKMFPLDSITRVRWDHAHPSEWVGVGNSGVTGMPPYTIAVGDNHSVAVISLWDGNTYGAFLDRLWGAVCVRLMGDMLVSLRDGRQLIFGDAVVTDLGVTLPKHKMFGANEKVFCDFGQIKVWSACGCFYIGSKSDGNAFSAMSYFATFNVHLLEHFIRLSLKNHCKNLSGLLSQK